MNERTEIKIVSTCIAILGISLMFGNYMFLEAGFFDHIGELIALNILAGVVVVVGIIGYLFPERIVLYKINEKER